MNPPSTTDPALGNIIQVLADVGFSPLTIHVNLENPNDPYYMLEADLGFPTVSALQFDIQPASDEVTVRFRDGNGWPNTSCGTGDVVACLGPYSSIDECGHWQYERACDSDAFASYPETLRTIDSFTACATFDRHVDLSLDSGMLSSQEADSRRTHYWYIDQVFKCPLSPDRHPFSQDAIAPPSSMRGGAS